MKTITSISLFAALLFAFVCASPAQVTYNGQTILTGSVTVTNCGTGAAVATANSLSSGTITMGTGATAINSQGQQVTQPVTNCTVTASHAFTNPPAIVITPWIKNVTATVKVVSSTVFTVAFSVNMAGQKFSFIQF